MNKKTTPFVRDDKALFTVSLRIASIVFVLFTAFTLLLAWLIPSFASKKLNSSFENTCRKVASEFADDCTDALLRGDLLYLESAARNLGMDESIIDAAIITFIEMDAESWEYKDKVTDQGLVIAASNLSRIGKSHTVPDGSVFEEQPGNQVGSCWNYTDNTLVLIHPIIAVHQGQQQVVGLAEIIADSSESGFLIMALRRNVLMYGVVAMLVATIATLLLINTFMRPVGIITDAMTRLIGGDFSVQVNDHSNTEIGRLARQFNRMAADLDSVLRFRTREAVARRERKIARQIQQSLLLEVIPAIPTLDVCTRMISSKEVGGDYYDIIQVNEHIWAFVIGDVSGNGITGATVMSMTRSFIRSQVKTGHSPASVLAGTNRLVRDDVPSGLFVTLALACYDTRSGELTMSSAGHNPAIILRNRKVMQLKLPGMPLGAVSGKEFDEIIEEGVLTMKHDDLILMFTDGITEAMNREENLFGYNRLQQVMQSYNGGTMESFSNNLVRQVEDFRNGAKQNDDYAFITIKRILK